ncbi:nestin isoform X7 [Lepisosteus oculatus]|uniref:nestin isoform X7 n=1 Tax=Lepisosteus oculatus TaxID=7918 RepID=UPI0035F50FC0
MGTQGTGRKRIPNRERLTAEDDALNQIAREAEARLAAKRAARAEAREIRMKELERQQKEIYQVQKKYYGLDNKWGDIEQWMEDNERYSRRTRRNTSISDDDERMSVGSRGSLRSDLDSVTADGGAGSRKKSKKKKHSKASSRHSDESRISKSSRHDLQLGNYCSSDLYSNSSLSSSKLQSTQNGARPSMLYSDAPQYRSYRGSVYEDSVCSAARRFNGSNSRAPSEYSGFLGSNSRASSRASSARASPVSQEDCSSVAGFLRSAASSSSVLRDLDDVTIPDLPDVEERSDRDFLEKGSRTASTLSAATLASLGGSSSRRGSGDTSISADTEASIREIKDIHELKDQVQDVELRYIQGLKEVKDSLAEVEEKYRKAMVSNAQMDNEKSNLMYQVDTLKDSLMELEEQLSETRRAYEEKTKEYERERHAHSVLQFQFNEMKETLRQSEELLTEVRQLRLKQDGYVREVSDLQETLEWKDKKIGALERQKEYSDAIRNERDELRDEVVLLKDVLKRHGIVLGQSAATNGEAGEGGPDRPANVDSSPVSAQDPSQTLHSSGDGLLGKAKEVQMESKDVKDVGNKQILEKDENNSVGQHRQQEGAESQEGLGGEKTQEIQGGSELSSPAPCEDSLNNIEEQRLLASIPSQENPEKAWSDSSMASDSVTQVTDTDKGDTHQDGIQKPIQESKLGGDVVCGSTENTSMVDEGEQKREIVVETEKAGIQVVITGPEEEMVREGDEGPENGGNNSEKPEQTSGGFGVTVDENKYQSSDTGSEAIDSASSGVEIQDTNTIEGRIENKTFVERETELKAASEISVESAEVDLVEKHTESKCMDSKRDNILDSGIEGTTDKDVMDGSGQIEKVISVDECATPESTGAVSEEINWSISKCQEEIQGQEARFLKSEAGNTESARDSTLLSLESEVNSVKGEINEELSESLVARLPEGESCDNTLSDKEHDVAITLSEQLHREQYSEVVLRETESEGEERVVSGDSVTPVLPNTQSDPESKGTREEASLDGPTEPPVLECADDPGRDTTDESAIESEGKENEVAQGAEPEMDSKPDENDLDNRIQEEGAEVVKEHDLKTEDSGLGTEDVREKPETQEIDKKTESQSPTEAQDSGCRDLEENEHPQPTGPEFEEGECPQLTGPELKEDERPQLAEPELKEDERPQLAEPELKEDERPQLAEPELEEDKCPQPAEPEHEEVGGPQPTGPEHEDDGHPQPTEPELEEDECPQVTGPELKEDEHPQSIGPELKEDERLQSTGPELEEDECPQPTGPELEEDGRPQPTGPELQEDGSPQVAGPELKEDECPQPTGPEIKEDGRPQPTGSELEEDGCPQPTGPELKEDRPPHSTGPELKEDRPPHSTGPELEEDRHPQQTGPEIQEDRGAHLPGTELEKDGCPQPTGPEVEDDGHPQPTGPDVEDDGRPQPTGPDVEDDGRPQPAGPVLEEDGGPQPTALELEEDGGPQPTALELEEDGGPQPTALELEDDVRPQPAGPEVEDDVRPQPTGPEVEDDVRPQPAGPELEEDGGVQPTAPEHGKENKSVDNEEEKKMELTGGNERKNDGEEKENETEKDIAEILDVGVEFGDNVNTVDLSEEGKSTVSSCNPLVGSPITKGLEEPTGESTVLYPENCELKDKSELQMQGNSDTNVLADTSNLTSEEVSDVSETPEKVDIDTVVTDNSFDAKMDAAKEESQECLTAQGVSSVGALAECVEKVIAQVERTEVEEDEIQEKSQVKDDPVDSLNLKGEGESAERTEVQETDPKEETKTQVKEESPVMLENDLKKGKDMLETNEAQEIGKRENIELQVKHDGSVQDTVNADSEDVSSGRTMDSCVSISEAGASHPEGSNGNKEHQKQTEVQDKCATSPVKEKSETKNAGQAELSKVLCVSEKEQELTSEKEEEEEEDEKGDSFEFEDSALAEEQPREEKIEAASGALEPRTEKKDGNQDVKSVSSDKVEDLEQSKQSEAGETEAPQQESESKPGAHEESSAVKSADRVRESAEDEQDQNGSQEEGNTMEGAVKDKGQTESQAQKSGGARNQEETEGDDLGKADSAKGSKKGKGKGRDDCRMS